VQDGRVTASQEHWDSVYESKRFDEVSWFEAEPEVSFRLVRAFAPPLAAVLDVGAGTATLVDRLVATGSDDVTVLDVSDRALRKVEERLGPRSTVVRFVRSDVLGWQPDRTFDVWHDRAVFHFLTDREQRQRYVRMAMDALADDGAIVLATFAEDGPEQCSGLPVARYSADALAAQLPALTMVHAERVEHVTPAGAVQPFTYVVLRR
jgi:SAM-dependent methyltransferase